MSYRGPVRPKLVRLLSLTLVGWALAAGSASAEDALIIQERFNPQLTLNESEMRNRIESICLAMNLS